MVTYGLFLEHHIICELGKDDQSIRGWVTSLFIYCITTVNYDKHYFQLDSDYVCVYI